MAQYMRRHEQQAINDMSRFYDALKQASGADLGINSPEDGFASDGNHDAPADSLNGTAAAVIAAADTSPGDPWVISPEQEPHPRRRSSLSTALGVLQNITVDRSARVLPNAVSPAVVEHYRRLRTKVIQQHAIKPFRSLVITSAGPQEGKTVTVLNLALSFAMLPAFRILLVDGDMRRGTLGKWLGASDRPGLSNLIDGSHRFDEVFFKCDDAPIHFIPKGTSTRPAAELLHSSQLSSHFRRMTEQFDLVLVDSPPVNLVTDTQLLATNCDAVLLVARAFATSRKALEKAVQDLSPFRIIGTVLNGSARAELYRGYNGYY